MTHADPGVLKVALLNVRQSPECQPWRALLHHFYDPFPTVLHYRDVAAGV